MGRGVLYSDLCYVIFILCGDAGARQGARKVHLARNRQTREYQAGYNEERGTGDAGADARMVEEGRLESVPGGSSQERARAGAGAARATAQWVSG